MKKLFFIILCFFLSPSVYMVFALSKEDIIPTSDTNFSTLTEADGLDSLDIALYYVRDAIFGLLALIFISVMIYNGIRLFIARGNEEQYQKALWSFLYAVVGLVIVLLSYAAVRLIVGLSL